MVTETPLTCEHCGQRFEAQNRNGVRKRFCSRRCKNLWSSRLSAEARRRHKAKRARNPKGPSKHAEEVSRQVFQAVVPLHERAECIIQACRNLGITDEVRIRAALAQNGVDPGRIPSDVLQALLSGHPVEGHA